MKYSLMAGMFFFGGVMASAPVNAGVMSQATMKKIVAERVELISRKRGYVVFEYKKVRMALISDVKHDRMRIIAPITDYSKIAEEVKDAAMESNFHSALDARYGVSKGVLYSAFIHPMSPLTEAQLKHALDQVSNLARTFGTTYTSGSLQFLGGSKKKTKKPASEDVGV